MKGHSLDLQIKYAASTLQKELTCWKAVIHLNIVRSIRIIIEALDFFMKTSPVPASSSRVSTSSSAYGGLSSESGSSIAITSSETDSLGLHHLTLLLRLRHLADVEISLIKRLGGPDTTETFRKRNSLLPLDKIDMWEVHVRPETWKKKLLSPTERHKRMKSSVRHPTFDDDADDSDDDDSIPHIINACKETMDDLWRDPLVQTILARMELRLEELPGL